MSVSIWAASALSAHLLPVCQFSNRNRGNIALSIAATIRECKQMIARTHNNAKETELSMTVHLFASKQVNTQFIFFFSGRDS